MDSSFVRWIKAKVSNLLTRAIIKGVKQIDGQFFVQVEGLKDDISSDVEYRQQFGFRSNPPLDSRCLLIAYGGDTDNLTAILTDNKNIETDIEFEDGESRQFDASGNARHRIYGGKHYLQGDQYELRIDDDNKIDFVAGTLTLTVGGQTYTFTGSNATFSKDLIADGISVKTHTHSGVQSGGSNTGPPS